MNPAEFRLAAIILGGGASRRMGSPKLLLPWRGATIIDHLIRTWRALGAAQITVVRSPSNDALAEILRSASVSDRDQIVNPDPDRGMFSSIREAAMWNGWKSGLTHWALILGDQPHLTSDSLRTLLHRAAAEPTAVWQPRYAAHRRHPVIMPAAVFHQLRVSSHKTLNSFLDDHPRRVIEMDDARFALDLDRPEDYEAARKQYETEL